MISKNKKKVIRKELTFTEDEYLEILKSISSVWNNRSKYRLPFVNEWMPKPKTFLEDLVKYMLTGDGKKLLAAGDDTGVTVKRK